MTKVTKKSKKAELVAAAMERKLYANAEEANKLNNKELYEAIMACDRVRILAVEEATKAEQQAKVMGSAEEQQTEPKVDKKVKKSLPKRDDKKKTAGAQAQDQKIATTDGDNSGAVGAESKTADNPVDAMFTDVKPFREVLLSLIRKNCGVNLASVKKSGLQKGNYTKSIDFLNKSIENLMCRFNSGNFEEDDQVDGGKAKFVPVDIHIVDKKGEVQNYVVNVYVSAILDRAENNVNSNVTIDAPKEESSKVVVEAKPAVEVSEEPDTRTDEEKATAESIVATLEALHNDVIEKDKTIIKLQSDFEKACEIGNNLDREMHKVQKQLTEAVVKRKQMYTDIISISNQIAATRDEHLLATWELLNKWLDKFVPADGDISVRFDMSKIVADVKKAEAKGQGKVDDDADYEGANVSFINGEIVCPDGVKKKVFKEYKAWCEDCDSWVSYAVEQLDKIGKSKNRNASKLLRKELLNDLKGWYNEWKEAGCDNDVVEMVEETMLGLLNHNLSIRMTMSYLVAVVDELELV